MTYTVPAPVQPASEYIGAAELAKLIRRSLARHFPGVTFSVRSSTYSGGCSVRVKYAGIAGYRTLSSCHCPDGPTTVEYSPNQCRVCGYLGRLEPIYHEGMPEYEAVRDCVARFEGKGFDGMIDMAYSMDVYLDADGEPVGGSSGGTQGSRGSDPAYETHMDGLPRGVRRIRSGAYVSVEARD